MRSRLILLICLLALLEKRSIQSQPGGETKEQRQAKKYTITQQHLDYFKISSIPATYTPLYKENSQLGGECKAKDFIPDKVLGRGGFGVVFRALHKLTNQYFAIKYLEVDGIKGQGAALLLEEEITYKLKHPNISKYYCSMKAADGGLLQVMELCNGSSLRKATKHPTRSFTIERYATIMRQLLSALRYLHSRGIIHRDIKAQNVILLSGSEDKVKLIDFGLAIKFKKGDKLTHRAGTLGYFAPELMRRQNYNLAVDLYALGIILYVIFKGEYPYEIDDWDDLPKAAQKLDRGEELIPLTGNSQVDEIIKLLTQENCNDRLKSVYSKSENGVRLARFLLDKRFFQSIQDQRANIVKTRTRQNMENAVRISN